MLSEKAASTLPGKVHIDANVRDFLERRAQSLRYPNDKRDDYSYQNRLNSSRQYYESTVKMSEPIERHQPLPPPSLVQNTTVDQWSSRRSEMSAIANQEEERITARARVAPSEFYSHPTNRYKSLPLTSKNYDEKHKKTWYVRSYRWIKKTILGKKKTTSSPTSMDRPTLTHFRSYSLPRNTRFNRKQSSRREPPAPTLVASGSLARVPPSRSSEFSVQQETSHQIIRRSDSSHQLADRRSNIYEEEEGMNPLLLGFPNLGNSCYWNAILQALGSLEPVAAAYLNRDTKRLRRDNEMSSVEEFSMAFTKLIESMWKNSDGGEYIHRLRSIFQKENSNFGRTHQEDAHEFLVCLMTMLTKDAFGNECFDPSISAVGLDNGVFKKNFCGYVKNGIYCATCSYQSVSNSSFTPFITLSFPERNDALFRFNMIRDSEVFPRMVRYSIHVPGGSGLVAANKLIAHETGISDSQLLLFQLNFTAFSQSMITEHDLYRNRYYNDGDEIYAAELEPVRLKNGHEVVTLIFIHSETSQRYGLRRLTEPFKTIIAMNASYGEILNAVKTATGRVMGNAHVNMYSATDLMIVDDNEFDGRILNRTVRAPLINANASRCMDEQTRIIPNLPRYLRLVVRWRLAHTVNTAHDSIARHKSYMESTPPNYPITLDLLFSRYFAPEYVADWVCERCRSKGGVRTSRYSAVPNIIAVSLKRFHTNELGATKKVEKPVVFPLENFSVSRYVDDETFSRNEQELLNFDVISFLCHYGHCENGHYYAYSRSPTTGVWRRYDDNLVAVKKYVEDNNAYIIFLQNHTDREARRRNISTYFRDTNFFQSLRRRKSRESLNRIPNGPVVPTEDQPYRRDSFHQLSQHPNGKFDRNDMNTASRQTHL